MSSILETLIVIAVSVTAVSAIAIVGFLATAYKDKLQAETILVDAQANHVEQTAEVELNTLAETIKAHEKNGANKLRGEIARLGGDLKLIEDKLGSKITGAISLAEHEKILAKSREIVTALNQQLENSSPVFSGQPSPGASIAV